MKNHDALMKNPKSFNILFSFRIILYVFLIGFLACCSYFVFERFYYTPMFVSGPSMNPTLKGGSGFNQAEFGLLDTHQNAINNIKRFDIVRTYYSYDYDAEGKLKPGQEIVGSTGSYHKIKRMIAFPGEKLKVWTDDIDGDGVFIDHISINDKEIIQNFSHIDIKNEYSRDWYLGKNQYFVMGDNRENSSDSRQVGVVLKHYITGVLSQIKGTCTISEKKVGESGYAKTCINKNYYSLARTSFVD